jgi:hypothetical protein
MARAYVVTKRLAGIQVRTFCLEKACPWGGDGKPDRKYTALTYPSLWQHMADLPSGRRCWYEIIREGQPCHLYFDLEFQKDINEGLDGDVMVDRLLAIVAASARCALHGPYLGTF